MLKAISWPLYLNNDKSNKYNFAASWLLLSVRLSQKLVGMLSFYLCSPIVEIFECDFSFHPPPPFKAKRRRGESSKSAAFYCGGRLFMLVLSLACI